MRTPEQGRSYFAVQCTCASHTLKVSLVKFLCAALLCAAASEAQTCPGSASCSGESASKTPALRSSSVPAMGPVTADISDITDAGKGARESVEMAVAKRSRLPAPDFNREIYYRNKLEFSLDAGWLPINIPFPFDVFEGDP